MSNSFDVQTRDENNTIRKASTKKVRMGVWIFIKIDLQVAILYPPFLPWIKKSRAALSMRQPGYLSSTRGFPSLTCNRVGFFF
jgi:hypothetical protein